MDLENTRLPLCTHGTTRLRFLVCFKQVQLWEERAGGIEAGDFFGMLGHPGALIEVNTAGRCVHVDP